MTQSPKAPYSITTLPHGNAFLISVCEGNPLITDGFLLQISSYIELWCSLFCQPEQVIEKRSRFVTPWRDVTLMNLSLDKIDSGVTWWLWVTACHSIKYLCKQNNHNILQNMTSSRQSTLTQWMQKKKQNDLCQNSFHYNTVIILQYWSQKRFVVCSVTSHYQNQRRTLMNWIHNNKFWNLNQNTSVLIHKKALQNTVTKSIAKYWQ